MRGVLDYYPKEILRMVKNSVTINYKRQWLFIKEPMKTEDADIKDADKDCRREAMEKPTKAKSVTWGMTPGAAKAMPRMTPARSSWRIWDPGRCKEAHRD